MSTDWVRIREVRFRREDFVILTAYPFSIVGSLPFWSSFFRSGLTIGIQAKEVEDPRYGRQLKPTSPALFASPEEPLSVLGAIELGLLSQVDNPLGVGFADRLSQRGNPGWVQQLAQLASQSDQAGLETHLRDPFLIEGVLHGWGRFELINRLILTLVSVGVTPSVIGIILSGWPTSKILQDPWGLVDEGVLTMDQAVGVADQLGIVITDEIRARSLSVQALQKWAEEGHVARPATELVGVIRSGIPNWDLVQSVRAFKDLQTQGVIQIDRIDPVGSVVYLPQLYQKELESSQLVVARMKSARMENFPDQCLFLLNSTGEKTVGDAVEKLVQNYSHLSPEQRGAIRSALLEGVYLLTGLPGTGKTTTLRALIGIFKNLGLRVKAVAPTGVAARRIQELCQTEAQTFHSEFGYRPTDQWASEGDYIGQDGGNKNRVEGDEVWRHGPEDPLPADVLIVDESSMLDQNLFHRALIGTTPECRIILVGDPAQIPSVGPGQILSDLLAVPQIPSCSLQAVFRQAGKSPIVHGAHQIHRGIYPDIRHVSTVDEALSEAHPEDLCLLEVGQDGEAQRAVLDLMSRVYQDPTRYGTSQLLSPRHAGEVGVKKLNEILRDQLNPSGPDEIRTKLGTIRVGDRIMVTRNNPVLGVYNGDVGIITNLTSLLQVTHGGPSVAKSNREKFVVIQMAGKPSRQVELKAGDGIRVIRLAYAVTYHKSQGQEYDTTVIVLMPSFGNQVTRRLLYTAVTRAKHRCILVGTQGALGAAISRSDLDGRGTYLSSRIQNIV